MNPWIIVGFLVALAAAGFGGSLVGERLNDQAWQKREAQINADAANKIAAADKKVSDLEHAHADEINNVAMSYEKRLQEKDHARIAAVAAAKSSGLFIHSSCPTPTGNAGTKVATAPGVGDGSSRTRLPDEDAEFLLNIASEADGIVAQLTACQAVIQADRK